MYLFLKRIIGTIKKHLKSFFSGSRRIFCTLLLLLKGYSYFEKSEIKIVKSIYTMILKLLSTDNEN